LKARDFIFLDIGEATSDRFIENMLLFLSEISAGFFDDSGWEFPSSDIIPLLGISTRTDPVSTT
jgi:hypothetical protein